MSDPAACRRFRRFAAMTVTTIYLLILVGGIVRATGSGMGCPDWPTCFGRWIPPTSEAELPADYQAVYADRGYAETRFNVAKTWTEYLNRLLGVLTGFAILATLLAAWPLRRQDRQITILSALAFVLVGVQGWLGSRVVASNLDPGMITLHMLLAQLIVALVILALMRSWRSLITTQDVSGLPRMVRPLLLIAMAAGLVQLVMGTQVREAVDLIAKQSDYVNRHLWIDNLPLIFATHKWYALPLFVLNLWVVFEIFRFSRAPLPRVLGIILLVLMSGTITIGMGMERLHLPIFAQPLHLWFGSLIFGVQFALWYCVRSAASRAERTTDQPPGRPDSVSDKRPKAMNPA